MPIGGFSVSHISKNRGYRGQAISGHIIRALLVLAIFRKILIIIPFPAILAISWPGSSRGFGARRHSGLEKDMPSHLATIAILLAAGIASPSLADGLGRGLDGKLAPGLAMPEMDAAKGRLLFGSKGCVVCHSINGIGGEDARAFGAEYMDDPMNPFDFAAAMWRGAEPMVMMQQEELGGQIELTGDELASIIAFVHDADEQKKFSDRDIPQNIRALMKH
ncbi:c-type cytochrome [Paracoccus sp. (in: a-proteobacteria)]|uniref:c-type cytochrome n=1 Tax=Paracoccus sp. TaxID=267 RepID=UPI0040588144